MFSYLAVERNIKHNPLTIVISITYILLFTCLDVRLIHGRTHEEGLVLIRQRHAPIMSPSPWGTVCDDGWDDADATVICRMLGFRGKWFNLHILEICRMLDL